MQPSIIFDPQFVANPDELMRVILAGTVWDARMQARLTASYGVPYNYSGMSYPAVPMPPFLQEVCAALYARLNFLANNCLMNNYAEGTSTMGFHADSVTELVPGTGVAIVSLGDTRTLTFRRTDARDVRWNCPLPPGSLLYMPPDVQSSWQHGVLKQPEAGQRISLTFRSLAAFE